MALNDLFPGFIRVYYHSQFAPHVQTIPTRQPAFATIGDVPTYTAWDASSVSATVMMTAYLDALKALVVPDISIDSWTAFNVTAPGAEPQPVFAETYGHVGTATLTGWAAAVQRTYIWRTTAFGFFKLVVLDNPTDNSFNARTPFTSEEVAVETALINSAHAFSGRDGFQPLIRLGVTVTLNEKLRANYHLA